MRCAFMIALLTYNLLVTPTRFMTTKHVSGTKRLSVKIEEACIMWEFLVDLKVQTVVA